MGIHGLSKVIGDHAPSGSKENEIKNYFGKSIFSAERMVVFLTKSKGIYNQK